MSLDLPQNIHVVQDLVVPMSTSATGHARLCRYGSELEVTPEIIEATRDRFGASWLEDWLTSGQDEYRRGDRAIARRGPWPAGTCRLRPGSFEWADAREQAVREAFQITDAAARTERRREIEEFYGPAPTTSRTHATISAGGLQ